MCQFDDIGSVATTRYPVGKHLTDNASQSGHIIRFHRRNTGRDKAVMQLFINGQEFLFSEPLEDREQELRAFGQDLELNSPEFLRRLRVTSRPLGSPALAWALVGPASYAASG